MKILILMFSVIFLSSCSVSEVREETTNTGKSNSIIRESSSEKEKIEELEKSETSSSIQEIEEDAIVEEKNQAEYQINLGTIYYQDLDINDPIQANSQYLGCYIVDDGSTVNLIPLMAATVQNLQIYTSSQGNEDYYQQFLNIAIETSNLTGGKPVSIFDREDGEVIITAENGEITYSK
ncbi:hypothetical protein ACODGR_09150 [Vagococcus fluvialis]|uniref:hypothetical protein n=2 Tax=Vagococcus fluvialis TaxID=2738 RepID=UPI001A8F7F43|nr:hypothetical protein [Vagococcus fluvialis]MBO0478358.1 hypothetical protein [Vagococcus fluvialis]MBO0484741.1 hypothetical protein [Vagococcus fluvialis]